MNSSVDLTQHMTSLFKAGVLDVNLFSYLKLRKLNPTGPVTLDSNVYSGTQISADLFNVAAALWQKGLVKINPFPNVTVRFSNEPDALSEAEILRSQDTISSSTHIFNALQGESSRLNAETVVIDDAFRTRWKVTTDDLLRYLPGVLKKAYEADRLDTFYSANPSLVWTATATHNPSETTEADLKSLFALGLSNEAYFFWILNAFLELRSPIQADLAEIGDEWGLDADNALGAAADLVTAKVMTTYQADSINVVWLKTLSTLGTAEIDYAGALMSAEGKMMYQLWKYNSPVEPSLFSTLNGVTLANFYKNLRRIKAKGIIDISTSNLTATWSAVYNPPPPSNALRAPTGVTVTAIDSSKIRVTWTQPSSGVAATNWRVMYRVKNSGVAYSEKNPATSPAVVTGLSASTEYEVYVYSEGGGDLKPSNTAYGSTTAASSGGNASGSGSGSASGGNNTPTIPTNHTIWLKFDPGELQTNSGSYGPVATTGDSITSVTNSGHGNTVKLGENSGFVVYNQPQPAAYTRSAWIKITEYFDWSALFGAETGTEANRHNLMVNEDHSFALWSNYDWIATYDWVIPLNQWVHVASTFENGAFKLYVNGALVMTENNLTYAPDSTNSTVFIGLMGFGNASWNNYIDDVVWYSRALTQAEVTQLYQVTTV
ncbi:MAG: fibronectin type III domain-containing protein [Brasilonema angustatum HA4187-MV1]|jgi:hypothetical protein|nr:fibronectin type III domain-containing protein [Brasilonema angustatum HA4187-MV1]